MFFIPQEAQTVIDALRSAGGRPYIVGGWVRDEIMGKACKDIDIEVGLLQPDQVRDALQAVCDKVDFVGVSFGVFKVTINGFEMDVSLPRTERKNGVGNGGFDVTVDPFMSTVDAAARRDFTLNSMMYDPSTGDVIDHFNGRSDLDKGILRHTSKAFSDDPLRVLRAMQFAARWKMTLAPETAKLCNLLIGEFWAISVERLYIEFEKLLIKGTDVFYGINVLKQTGWLAKFPQLAILDGCPQDAEWHPEGDVLQHTGHVTNAMRDICNREGIEGTDRMVMMLAAVCHDLGKPATTERNKYGRWSSPRHAHVGVPIAERFMQSIGVPVSIIERVLPLVKEHMVHIGVVPRREIVAKLARRLQPATLQEWAFTVEADVSGRPPLEKHQPVQEWVDMAQELNILQKPMKGLIQGRNLIAIGLKPSPVFGEIIEAALKAQMKGTFTDDEGAAAWLEKHVRYMKHFKKEGV